MLKKQRRFWVIDKYLYQLWGLGLTVVEKQRTGKGCLEMLALAKEIQSFLKF